MFSADSTRAMRHHCFKSRKPLMLEILSKYISLWLRKGEREGWRVEWKRIVIKALLIWTELYYNGDTSTWERKLFRITVDWQYDNCSLKMDDSYGITAQCTTQDEWMLQVLPEWAPVSQGFVSAPNKYVPVFCYISKCSISLQTQVLPVASKRQCHVPA